MTDTRLHTDKKITYLILNDIRSVYNVGAIFRTADAIGIDKIYLTGITPTPLDRFMRPRADLAKSALGAEKNVPWEYIKSPLVLINKLKKQGFTLYALEQDPQSVDYKKVTLNSKSAVIVGNEVSGVTKKLLSKVDTIAEIPMNGTKESLNVSVSLGIVIYRWLDR